MMPAKKLSESYHTATGGGKSSSHPVAIGIDPTLAAAVFSDVAVGSMYVVQAACVRAE